MLLYKRRNFYKLFFYEGLSSPFREEISQRSRPNYIEQRSSNSLKRPKLSKIEKKYSKVMINVFNKAYS